MPRLRELIELLEAKEREVGDVEVFVYLHPKDENVDSLMSRELPRFDADVDDSEGLLIDFYEEGYNFGG